ncbi:MAG: hypothetical protein R3E32_10240 [Chitinophagales bacterium]
MSGLYIIESSFGQFLIYTITVLFIVAVFVVVREIVRFQVTENEAFKKLNYNFHHEIDWTQQASLTRESLYEILKKDCKTESIACNRLSTIYYLARQAQEVKQDVLTDTDILEEDARFSTNYLRYARSAMVILGLLGTLFGFAQSVGYASFIFSEINTATIQTLLTSYTDASNQMMGMLIPMKSALLTSFWGVLATVFLSLLLLPLNWIKQQFFAKLEVFSTTQLIPVFNPAKKDFNIGLLIDTVTKNTIAVNEIVTKVEQISTNISKDYEYMSQYSRSMQASTEGFVEAQEMLHGDLQTLTQLVKAYKENEEKAGESQYKIIEALNLHNITLERISKKIQETEFNVGDWLQEIIQLSKEQQRSFKMDVEALVQLTKQNLNNLQSVLNRFGLNVNKFETNLDKMSTYLTHFSSTMEEVTHQEVEQIKVLAIEMKNLGSSLSQIQANIPQQMDKLTKTLQETNVASNPKYIEKVAQEIADQEIKKRMKMFEEERQQIGNYQLEAHHDEDQRGGIRSALKNMFNWKDEE